MKKNFFFFTFRTLIFWKVFHWKSKYTVTRKINISVTKFHVASIKVIVNCNIKSKNSPDFSLKDIYVRKKICIHRTVTLFL